jgi:hypothetical protein
LKIFISSIATPATEQGPQIHSNPSKRHQKLQPELGAKLASLAPNEVERSRHGPSPWAFREHHQPEDPAQQPAACHPPSLKSKVLHFGLETAS